MTWTDASPGPKPENISEPIPLEGGRRYYIEALMQEGAGQDNLSVAWQLPGQPAPRNGELPIRGSYLAVPEKWLDPGSARLTSSAK